MVNTANLPFEMMMKLSKSFFLTGITTMLLLPVSLTAYFALDHLGEQSHCHGCQWFHAMATLELDVDPTVFSDCLKFRVSSGYLTISWWNLGLKRMSGSLSAVGPTLPALLVSAY